jgi:hypothetical protein
MPKRRFVFLSYSLTGNTLYSLRIVAQAIVDYRKKENEDLVQVCKLFSHLSFLLNLFQAFKTIFSRKHFPPYTKHRSKSEG